MSRLVELSILINVLEKAGTKNTAITPDQHAGTGLEIKRRLRTEDGKIIFIYVDRNELIEHLKKTYNLFKKGTQFTDVVHRIT